jgi:hypothetical protein
MDWSREEVEAIVADYLHMLTLELSGQTYNKTEHRRRLQTVLAGRSEASIEFKHCNISAALMDLGVPRIQGYQPRANYQGLLADVVADQVETRSRLDQAAQFAVEQPAIAPIARDFSKIRTQAPLCQPKVTEADRTYGFRAIKRDYFEREAANRSLGMAGEEFVVQFEHWRLVQFGQQRLADRVEHVAATKGDGLGYDVLSFDGNGRERFIEVKTTSFGKDTPFFVSRGELALSRQSAEQFHLYRLFEFRKTPRLFELLGQLDQHCIVDPISYKASFS